MSNIPSPLQTELWNAASDWASEAAPLLKDLNTRTAFGIRVEESQRGNRCFEGLCLNHGMRIVLQVRSSEAGKHAAGLLRDSYNVFVDVEFDHSKER